MRDELKAKFSERWPKWFEVGPIQESLMCFGFEHSDGWFDLEWRLCEDLEKILGDFSPYYILRQIKEKFAGLRWYWGWRDGLPEDVPNGLGEKIRWRVNQAEEESYKTCEWCGQPGELDSSQWWILTLCQDCKQKRADERSSRQTVSSVPTKP